MAPADSTPGESIHRRNAQIARGTMLDMLQVSVVAPPVEDESGMLLAAVADIDAALEDDAAASASVGAADVLKRE